VPSGQRRRKPAGKRAPAKGRGGEGTGPDSGKLDRSQWGRVPCEICGEPSNARNLCPFHYYRWKQYGDPNFVTARVVDPGRGCSVEACEGRHKGRGYCEKHLDRLRKFGTVDPAHLRPKAPRSCAVEECSSEVACASYCWVHYQRWRKYGDPLHLIRHRQPNSCEDCGKRKAVSKGLCSSCYSRQWRHSNPDQKAAQRFVRRALMAAAPGACTEKQLKDRLAYYGGMCWICGARPGDTVDHVKPLTRGGSNWPANLRPACRPCNTSKGNRWPFVVAVAS
jgi:5-methylcytosine-specific restriction endonuclease McrA